MLFGSDYPLLTPDRWIADFAQLDIKPEVRPLIMKENAARLLGLAGPAPDRGRPCLVALDVDDLAQRVADLDQVGGVAP